MNIHRPAYSADIHPHSGVVERLSVPDDPPGVNMVHRSELTGFGAVAITRREGRRPWMAPSGRPLNVRSVHLDEHRLFAPAAESSADRVICRNAITGHSLTYEFADDHFDVWLRGDFRDADQVALDLDVAFMDLCQDDPPEQQFTVQCPYRSEDRSLCYVYLARPRGRGLLLTALTPAAGWRLRYNRNSAAPMAYRSPIHAILGLQMVARFDSALDSAWTDGPIDFGVRVSFPRHLREARASIRRWLDVPLLSAVTLGGPVGSDIPFEVAGPVAGVELVSKRGKRTPVEVTPAGDDTRVGHVNLPREGFYTLRAFNAAGRGSDLTLFAGPDWLTALRRAATAIVPRPPSNAEAAYWTHAFCLARRWLGVDPRREAFLADALVRIQMQGVSPAPTSLVPRDPPTPVAANMAREGHWFKDAPIPQPHEHLGKTFSPFHLFCHDRVQDAFAMVQAFLFAADAFSDEAYYEHAVRIAQAHLTDNMDAAGRIYRLTEDGRNTTDYTTVICPPQAIVDLAVAAQRRGDPRAGGFRDAALRTADYLVRRGLDFPTEGVPPHVRWSDDGSIACAALALLYTYWHLERRSAYLDLAREVLDYHEAWTMDVPDVRMHGSSFRYWETQWENDGEGRAINSGHPWTLWQAEALYYWGVIAGDARRLVQSFNGYLCNRCKIQPNGASYACFTPDYLPDRPRRFGLMHSYPRTRDGGISMYLWPRAADTWLRTVVVVDPQSAGLSGGAPVALNGCLTQRADGEFTLVSDAPFFDRLLVLSPSVRAIRLCGSQQPQLLHAPQSLVVTMVNE